MVKQKRRLQKGAALALSLLLLLGSLAGCGGKPQEDVSNANGSNNNAEYRPSSMNYVSPTNSYTPTTNEDGYIVITMPTSIIGISGATASELAADFQSAVPPDKRITDIVANNDGTADYFFTPEQFEQFKKDTYDSGCYAYGVGSFPQSIKTVEYTEIDENGIPWAAVVTIDLALYTASDMDALLGYSYGVAWPANYIGQYQIFCGVPGDEWAVHVTVKDADSGEVISEHDFPTRDK